MFNVVPERKEVVQISWKEESRY